MNDGKQAALSAIQKINAVEGFDPTPLAVEYVDLNTQEKRSRLPVMAQLAWFRLKYPEGRVSVAVTAAKDCFVATARVYPSYTNPPEQYLSEATASRGYQADKPTVSPREWAQTAAIGIALRNAGFGLQFSAAGDSFDSPAVDELGGIIWSREDEPQAPLTADMPPAAAPVATQSPAEPVDCLLYTSKAPGMWTTAPSAIAVWLHSWSIGRPPSIGSTSVSFWSSMAVMIWRVSCR